MTMTPKEDKADYREARQDQDYARERDSMRCSVDYESANVKVKRAQKKLSKRRKEIETIVNEMRNLDVDEKDEPLI